MIHIIVLFTRNQTRDTFFKIATLQPFRSINFDFLVQGEAPSQLEDILNAQYCSGRKAKRIANENVLSQSTKKDAASKTTGKVLLSNASIKEKKKNPEQYKAPKGFPKNPYIFPGRFWCIFSLLCIHVM